MSVAVRAERVGDAPVITDLVRRAYAEVPHSDHREHLMVERLRTTDAFVPALSLIAAIGEEPVGHILLVRAPVRGAGPLEDSLILAPLSVVPDRQRQGVGTRLVHHAHALSRQLGFGAIVVVGPPGYYQRFGYEPLGRYPIELPFHAPEANRMILPLRPGALYGVRGRVEVPPGWLDH